MSGIGFLSYVARDPAARSIIYWNLGTLSGSDRNAVFVVGAAISARFEPGRLHLIVGANGAGKSTLIKLLARLLRP
jgi:iron complex transport system permease protein